MSRIGKRPVAISDKVKIEIDDENNYIKISNGSDSLEQIYSDDIHIQQEGNELIISRDNDSSKTKALHGLYRSLVSNMVEGLTDGFSKTLDINGVGFRASLSGKTLTLNIGYSHPVIFEAPEGITFENPTATQIVVKGADKQLVGETAAKIRASRVPDVYHGKGIKYSDEVLRIKEGKTGAKG